MCKKIVFVSGSRSDFGLIQDIVKTSILDSRYKPYLLRIGHSNIDNIDYEKEKFKNLKIIKVQTKKGINVIDNNIDTSLAISEIIGEVTPILSEIKPSMLFIPGDRFEIFAVAISAYYQKIPIAHIFGGDKSQGGHLDDNIRHSITKMSHLHFSVCKDSYNRILKMGEEPWRVYNFGSPVVDNINKMKFKNGYLDNYAVFTYHPITNKPKKSARELDIIFNTLSKYSLTFYITSPNNEVGSKEILKKIDFYTKKFDNLVYVDNLGWKNYLNYVKFSKFTIGNSSSNLLETPILGIPSINIGDRQKGRYKPKSVISVKCKESSIEDAIDLVLSKKIKKDKLVYGNGNVGIKILDTIYKQLDNKNLIIKKVTY